MIIIIYLWPHRNFFGSIRRNLQKLPVFIPSTLYKPPIHLCPNGFSVHCTHAFVYYCPKLCNWYLCEYLGIYDYSMDAGSNIAVLVGGTGTFIINFFLLSFVLRAWNLLRFAFQANNTISLVAFAVFISVVLLPHSHGLEISEMFCLFIWELHRSLHRSSVEHIMAFNMEISNSLRMRMVEYWNWNNYNCSRGTYHRSQLPQFLFRSHFITHFTNARVRGTVRFWVVKYNLCIV